MFNCKDRKSTRLNSSHTVISYADFCLKKKIPTEEAPTNNVPAAAVIRKVQAMIGMTEHKARVAG